MTGNPPNFDPDLNTYKYILKYRKPVPCSNFMKWGRWMERNERRVRRTFIGDKCVSTVFLGYDHNFNKISDTPILFETMIFPDLNYQTRCSTWRQALKMHWEAIDVIRKA